MTKEEFEEYYNNISASIDNDQYFELMMNNAWKINDGNKSYGKAWANEDKAPQGKTAASQRGGNAPGCAAGQRIGTAASQQPAQTYSRPQTASGRQPASSGYNVGIGGAQQKTQQPAAAVDAQMSYSEQ